MRHWKFFTLPVLIGVLLSIPRSAPGSGFRQYRSSAGLPLWLLRLCPVQLRSIRILRARVVQRRRLHRSRPLVPRSADFHGYVDNHFDPHHGYRGPVPGRGDVAFNHFHGNEMRDGARSRRRRP